MQSLKFSFAELKLSIGDSKIKERRQH